MRGSAVPEAAQAGGIVCHCERVPYAAVEAAIASGRSRSLADLQRQTRACTRCFGCRFELERMLREGLGDRYVRTAEVTRIDRPSRLRGVMRRLSSAPVLPRRMYMPVLHGFAGSAVTTRIVVFNAADDSWRREVTARFDLLAPSGERLDAQEHLIEPGRSLVVEASAFAGVSSLVDGYGVVKMVIDAEALHSLRPYFQLLTPAGITTTHEKAGPSHPREIAPRPYHWLHPIGRLEPSEDAFFFCTNTQDHTMVDQRLIWTSVEGRAGSYPLPPIELDGSTFISFRQAFPDLATGTASGSVRLDPPLHKVAGFMLRHDVETDRWRVQHL